MNSDNFFMQRCLDLAIKGIGKTYPNPVVGCVIVNDNKIISEGWHKLYGGVHAEVDAINKIEDKLFELLIYPTNCLGFFSSKFN